MKPVMELYRDFSFLNWLLDEIENRPEIYYEFDMNEVFRLRQTILRKLYRALRTKYKVAKTRP